MRFSDLIPAARDTIADPRAGFRRMQALGLTRQELWTALVAITLVGVLLAEAMLWRLADRGVQPMLVFDGGPIVTAAIQIALMAVLAWGIFRGGRSAGGQGSFDDALLAVTWLQAILTLLQAVQVVVMMVLPPLTGLLGLFGIGLFFWLISGFIAELHGFRSRLKVFFAFLGAIFLFATALVILLPLLGITLPELPDV